MKKIIISIILTVFVLGIVGILILYKDQKVAVLGYHGFALGKENQEGNEMLMDVEKFEEQLKYLKDNGYKTLTLEEFYEWKNNGYKIPRKSVLITMDDGYLSNYYYAFPLLKKYDMNATVFLVGSYISKESKEWRGNNGDMMSFEQIEKSKTEYPNIEFASHSYNLHSKGAVSKKSYEELDKDVKKFKELYDTQFLAYPFGDYNDELIEVLKNNDYKMAFTFGPDKEHRKASKKDDNYKIPRLNISGSMSMNKFKLRLLIPF